MLENKKIGIQAVGLPVTDDNTVTTTVPAGEGLARFKISGIDPDLRYISVASNVEISTMLVPTNAIFERYVKFSSLDPRMFSMIAWHLMPGSEYELRVFPKTTPASVTVSMSKSGGGLNWVNNKGGQPFEEKNILFGGTREVYGFAFQTPGRYRFTVKTSISKLHATFGNSRNSSQTETKPAAGAPFSSQYVFEKIITVTGEVQSYYALHLISQDTPDSGAPYSIEVQRID